MPVEVDEEYDLEDEPIVIPLDNKGLITWISQEDADIAGWGWRAKQAGSKKYPKYYACHSYTIAGTTTDIYLHDLVWERMMGQAVPVRFLVDHISGDKLDNRRINLRLATRSQNEANKRKRQGNTTSKYKGVVKMKDGRKKCWRAILTTDTARKELGTYYTEKEAALAYNKAAYELWGEYALLNDIDEKSIKPSESPFQGRGTKAYKEKHKGRKRGRPKKNKANNKP